MRVVLLAVVGVETGQLDRRCARCLKSGRLSWYSAPARGLRRNATLRPNHAQQKDKTGRRGRPGPTHAFDYG